MIQRNTFGERLAYTVNMLNLGNNPTSHGAFVCGIIAAFTVQSMAHKSGWKGVRRRIHTPFE